MSEKNKEKLRVSINAIEAGYEFMLAYAAQGWDIENRSGGGGQSIRVYLEDMKTGLQSVADDFESVINAEIKENADVFSDYVAVLREDAEKSMKAVAVVMALPSIGSQIIDNLNASIHMRALLTDIFLLDEALLTFSKKLD